MDENKVLDFEEMMKEMSGDGNIQENITDEDEQAILASKLGKDKIAAFQELMQQFMDPNAMFGGLTGLNGMPFPVSETLQNIPPVSVKVTVIDEYKGEAKLPTYAHEGDAGFDFYVARDTTVPAGQTVLVPTGLAVAIDPGFYMTMLPRSGKSLKTGLRIANAPGTIDSGYRGHVQVIVWNTNDEDVLIKAGTRIAQGTLLPVIKAKFEEVDELDDTERSGNGFGSTDEEKNTNE